MFTGHALTELLGSLANELNSASSVVLGILLIAAGVVCLWMSRRPSAKAEPQAGGSLFSP
jgi:hypothetical protein